MSKKPKEKKEPENPIVRATATLVKAIRDADATTCDEAIRVLQDFADTWLISGDGSDLSGAGQCCLSDTDTTEAVKGAVEIQAENKSFD